MATVLSPSTSSSKLTLLQIIQSASKRIGLQAPTLAVNNTDNAIQQLVALSEEEGQEQATTFMWEALQVEAQFTTTASEFQGSLNTIAPGFDYVINDTMWNRTLRRPVYGPKTPQDWQQVKAMQLNGPFNSYRIKGDAIYFYPAPAAGQQIDFEYFSTYWVSTSAGGTSATWTNDNDKPLIDDQLLVLGLVWRWKAAKGLDYQMDYQKYEKRRADCQARDASRPILRMDGATYDIVPAVLVPRGTWLQ